MNESIYRVSAFSDNNNGGNPAGVVLDADKLTDDQMQQIAKDVGFSETAFVMKSNIADYKVRFFTPVSEVDLCGHATIGTFNLLRDLGLVNYGIIYTQETKAGVLRIKINNQCVYMEQNTPSYYEIINKKEIGECFLSNTKDYFGDLPIQIVSTGLKDILIPIKNLDDLLQLKPNLQRIKEISRKYDVIGLHLFSLDNADVHARNFAPLYGIDEESATGTSNGALACYLMKYLKSQFNGCFTIEQGIVMNKPSKIMVEVSYEDNEVKEVYVGGSAFRM